MSAFDYDVLVLGAGMAGLRAAVAAAKHSGKVAILTAAPAGGHGGCSYKTHGVNAAMNQSDSAEAHALDTYRGGGKIGNFDLIEKVTQGVKDEILYLESLGVIFDRVNRYEFDCGYYGGSTRGRSLHQKDYAGRSIVDALFIEAVRHDVVFLHDQNVTSLSVKDGECYGATTIDMKTQAVSSITARSTILALGGGACMWPASTISRDKTATGFTLAYEAGCALIDMEMVQFHPTGLNLPNCPGHGEILEEELRSMGGRFYNAKGERFAFNYDSRGERATRDIVARAAFTEIRAGRGTPRNGVLFDLREIDRDALLSRFPYMTQRLREFGVDVYERRVVETVPSAHFVMGGVLIDECAQSSVQNLFACGEDAGGIHGGNRLGGNGVADALAFGAIAGEHAMLAARRRSSSRASFSAPKVTVPVLATPLSDVEMDALKEVMWEKVGLIRDGNGLHDALHGISRLLEGSKDVLNIPASGAVTQGDIVRRSQYQKALFSHLVICSALERTNSVGAHFRTDSDDDNSVYNVLLQQDSNGYPCVDRAYRDETMDGGLSPEEAA